MEADAHPGPEPRTGSTTVTPYSGLGWGEQRPVGFNRFVEHAVNCNDATGTRDLEQTGRDHQALHQRYPVGGAFPFYAGNCVHGGSRGRTPATGPAQGRSARIAAHTAVRGKMLQLFETGTPGNAFCPGAPINSLSSADR